MKLRLCLALVVVLAGGIALASSPPTALAHRSGCHRWHSCPSDTGSYTCGDWGYYNYCPGGGPYVPPAPYVPPVSPWAGLPVSSSQSCGSNGRIDVTFRWTPSPSFLAQQQWVDLSIFNNGFIRGTFIGTGPFPLATAAFTWYGLLPSTTHYWRVNTLVSGTWTPSAGYEFTTGRC